MKSFKRLKFGFANLMMLGVFEKEAENKAVNLAEKAKYFLMNDLGVDVLCDLKAITNLDEAKNESNFFKVSGIDALILFNGTFSLGNLMTELIRNSEVPILAWGLEEYLIDKRILAGSMIGLMPIGMICKNLHRVFSFVYGSAETKDAQKRLETFRDVVNAIAYLRESRIGLIGARPDGFEISGFDELAIKRIFGATILKISMNDLLETIDSTKDEELSFEIEEQRRLYDMESVDQKGQRELARVYVGLKKTVEKNGLHAYAPQCWPELRMNRKTPICAANGRLSTEGIMASCECDMDCALTMLILYSLTGNIPWTADFVNYISENDSLLFWHCGNAPYGHSESKPKIEVVYEGPAQTAALHEGVVTVCRVNHEGNTFKIFAGLGKAIKEGTKLKGSNIFVRMSVGNQVYVEDMLAEGVPHHNVVVYGDATEKIREFAKFVGLPAVVRK